MKQFLGVRILRLEKYNLDYESNPLFVISWRFSGPKHINFKDFL